MTAEDHGLQENSRKASNPRPCSVCALFCIVVFAMYYGPHIMTEYSSEAGLWLLAIPLIGVICPILA